MTYDHQFLDIGGTKPFDFGGERLLCDFCIEASNMLGSTVAKQRDALTMINGRLF